MLSNLSFNENANDTDVLEQMQHERDELERIEKEKVEMQTLRNLSKEDREDFIGRVSAKLVGIENEREVLSLQLKKLFISGDFLRENDTYNDVVNSRTTRYLVIRKMLLENFAASLQKSLPTSGKSRRFSDFEAFNNYDLAKEKAKSGEIADLTRRKNKIQRSLYRLRDTVIEYWNLNGTEEYLKQQASKLEDKKLKKKLEPKTQESMQAGTFFSHFFNRTL